MQKNQDIEKLHIFLEDCEKKYQCHIAIEVFHDKEAFLLFSFHNHERYYIASLAKIIIAGAFLHHYPDIDMTERVSLTMEDNVAGTGKLKDRLPIHISYADIFSALLAEGDNVAQKALEKKLSPQHIADYLKNFSLNKNELDIQTFSHRTYATSSATLFGLKKYFQGLKRQFPQDYVFITNHLSQSIHGKYGQQKLQEITGDVVASKYGHFKNTLASCLIQQTSVGDTIYLIAVQFDTPQKDISRQYCQLIDTIINKLSFR